jgi:sugar lactone lactonase YvrE
MLFWTDILGKTVWGFDPDTERIKKVWQDDYMVGGITFTKDNALILCSEKGVLKMEIDKDFNALKASMAKMYDIDFDEGHRFNDVTTDPKGRIFAGTMCDKCVNGVLYRLEEDREPVILIKDIGISNGMAFSNDEKSFFHTDSLTKTITKYDYDVESGDISNPSVFYIGIEENGMPDGITIDINDQIWVACWGGAQILHLDKNGEIIEKIKIPATQVSSVMFGGKQLSTLFITTAAVGAMDIKEGKNEDGIYLGGQIFSYNTDTKGRQEWWV